MLLENPAVIARARASVAYRRLATALRQADAVRRKELFDALARRAILGDAVAYRIVEDALDGAFD